MVGINRHTGRPLSGFAHVRQSLTVLFTTRIGTRVMRRLFGSVVPGVLGKNIMPSTFLKFATAIHVACELWEPRYRLIQVAFPQETNDPDKVRRGRLGIALIGQYRPRGHLGDPTPEGETRTLIL